MALFQGHNELLLTCPYDPNHRVAPRRFDIHLIKCEKTSKIKLEKCPFNSNHRIAKELMAAHIVDCPSARAEICDMVERPWQKKNEVDDLSEQMGAVGLNNANPKPENADDESSEDEWSKEKRPHFLAPGLDGSKPTLHVGHCVNLFQYQNMTPAERKKWNQQMCIEQKKKEMKRAVKEYQEQGKQEMEERAKKDQEEQEKREKEKQEREKIAQEKAAKKKAMKERQKAAKRAAYFAKQAEEKNNEDDQ